MMVRKQTSSVQNERISSQKETSDRPAPTITKEVHQPTAQARCTFCTAIEFAHCPSASHERTSLPPEKVGLRALFSAQVVHVDFLRHTCSPNIVDDIYAMYCVRFVCKFRQIYANRFSPGKRTTRFKRGIDPFRLLEYVDS